MQRRPGMPWQIIGTPLHQIICPPLPRHRPSHTKNGSAFAAAALFGGRRRGGGDSDIRAFAAVHLWGGGGGAFVGGRRWRIIGALATEGRRWWRGIGSGAGASADADASLGLRRSARVAWLNLRCSARVARLARTFCGVFVAWLSAARRPRCGGLLSSRRFGN